MRRRCPGTYDTGVEHVVDIDLKVGPPQGRTYQLVTWPCRLGGVTNRSDRVIGMHFMVRAWRTQGWQPVTDLAYRTPFL